MWLDDKKIDRTSYLGGKKVSQVHTSHRKGADRWTFCVSLERLRDSQVYKRR